MTLGQVDIQTYSGANALLRDYVRSADSDVSKFLKRYGSKWTDEAGGAPPTGQEWDAVVDEIASLSSRLGTSEDNLRKLDGAKHRDIAFVVTGQQPGALGGPLHTIHKIATAIALADRVERDGGRPCVPLFWIGADDSDFAEIRPLHLWTDQLSPVSSAIRQDAHAGGMPVGDIELEPLSRLLADVRSVLSEYAAGREVLSRVDAAFDSAADHGELSAAIMMNLLEGRFVVVDGRSRSVRRFAHSVFSRYLDSESEVKTTVNAAGRRLGQLGYHAQLALGDEPGLFLLQEGRRKSVGEDRAPLLKTVQHAVEDLSPGVVVRNLVQDFTFRPAAVVLGPAELAYRAQMTPVYPQFDIPCPIAVPRMTATFIPPELADLVELHGGELGLLLEKPAEFARSTYRDAMPPSLSDAAASFQHEVNRMVDAFVDDHLGELPEKSRGKITGRFKDVARRADGAIDAVIEGGKTAAMARWPFLADLPDLMRPGHKPQERTLSLLVPFLVGGLGVADDLIEMAATHLDQLMDDRMAHIVYSTQS